MLKKLIIEYLKMKYIFQMYEIVNTQLKTYFLSCYRYYCRSIKL